MSLFSINTKKIKEIKTTYILYTRKSNVYSFSIHKTFKKGKQRIFYVPKIGKNHYIVFYQHLKK